ncbi:class I SAM-dependent methyltransferase [Leptolyngbya ohadii]|uniref:class I SAM-dependent methyltransferase n=1 Tax=Leptolyngbya ohadii TaxID=1962290 RepID=UPI0019D466FB|nr:class I SAM-dependent methyltransferase [Leptolyngbya ohadii]
MDSLPPLYTKDPTNRFSNRAADYAKYRPTYPSEAIDLLLEGFTHPISKHPVTVADIGAGTGISARLLAERGATVIAIEPNEAMRSAAEPHANVTFQEGTAEQTGLPTQSVDLVLCAQSFHWFDKEAALTEFHRILKPGGRVALMWNDRNPADPFTEEYSEILRRAADREIFDRGDRKSPERLAASEGFGDFQTHSFTHTYPLDRDALIGLVLSSSYMPKEGAAYEQLLADLQNLFDRWAVNDQVTLSYRTMVYVARSVDLRDDG